MTCTASIDTPIGPIEVVARDGAIVSVRFVDGSVAGVRACDSARLGGAESREACEAIAQLRAFFAGELREFDLPLAPWGTPFQARVLHEVRGISYGRTCTYGEIALRIGSAGASRAVGAANARNPWPIVVPCHRVVGAGGLLTGYGGGTWRKQWLLGHEGGGLALPLPAATGAAAHSNAEVVYATGPRSTGL
ncbi:MAG: methylated-DNA--[protein]-cysteine S-methyltransferase [Leptolyngbya sp. PLA2]|nr:methylated-DNA--[protein]-cysteine S-methyltransferase [Leptolyngbya sp.]MCE7971266.1 methylated-DNA--[protein]-cysteine S-methyltransferase [Leptolyngbya sp. PL-A2]MCQ3939625.1 cysteine methyltransferase [cyanobacterium CYA1]MCZ7632131.1 methylated-DNA--[protein]-cysteine S-methyltransferase [Phycisphaerales bacterium]MDL1903881.1 methylated-DNA--[protein]-cysteine S-methyltransferase [Synechococcales cyanobacterium CNB]GIK18595.1 MAG: methylated-DNA--protein-cysteine methyltransferase [Pl